MSVSTNRRQTIQCLALQLRQLEQAGGRTEIGNTLLSTGVGPLDRLLPDGGVPPGTLIEWLSQGEGSGAGTIACTVAVHAMQTNGVCVVIDRHRSFFPPAAWPLASNLDRTVVVHPANDRDTLWALEQSLRCSGVAVVLCRLDRLHDHAYRRLQLAAEAGGGVGLLLRPDKYRSQPSWADIRLLVETLPCESRFGQKPSSGTDDFSTGRLLRITLIHCRGRAGGDAVELEIDDETGDVRLAPQLAAATDSIRATRA